MAISSGAHISPRPFGYYNEFKTLNIFTLRVFKSGIGTAFNTLKKYQSIIRKNKYMCLYPRLIINKKYTPTKKNNFQPPKLTDERLKYVSVGCGNCIECRRQKASEWRTRLNEELKKGANGYFVTLTFTNENLFKLYSEYEDIKDDNIIAKIAVRRFLERWRRKYGKSLRHWLITELGHTGTERIHIHGVIFCKHNFNNDLLEKIWQYGMTYTGNYCNERTINYIVKYVTKIDDDHKGYIPKIMTSSGIGDNYITNMRRLRHMYKGNETIEYYTLPNGMRSSLPIYYRNKLFTEEEREQLWLNKIEQHTIYVNGIECANIDTEQGQEHYLRLLKEQQKDNIAKGYGDNSKQWQKREYRTILQRLNYKKYKKVPLTYRKLAKYLQMSKKSTTFASSNNLKVQATL